MIPRNNTLCSRPRGRPCGKAGRPRRRLGPDWRLLLLCLAFCSSASNCPPSTIAFCRTRPNTNHSRLARCGLVILVCSKSKPPSLAIFVLILNPKSHLIPGCPGFLCGQIADHTDGLLIALFPAHQHRPAHPISFLTPFSCPFPLTPGSLDSPPNGPKRFFSLRPKRQIFFDPQERMPPIGLDRLIQPGRIQPTIGHRQHGPLRRDHVGQLSEHPFPMRPPFPRLMPFLHCPGHSHPTSSIHPTSREHRKPIPQGAGIQGQHQRFLPLPPASGFLSTDRQISPRARSLDVFSAGF